MKLEKYNYFETLIYSFRLSLRNPKIFVPYIISFIIGMLSLPFVEKLQDPEFILSNILFFSAYGIFNLIAGLVIFGWTLSMINQLVGKNKAELGSSFKRCLSFGLRFFAISIILFIFMLAVYSAVFILIMIISALFSLIKLAILGAAIGGVIGALFLAFTIFFFTAALQSIPVLIVEDKGVIDTIIKTYKFYMNKKIYSLNIFLISLILGIILSMPGLLYQFLIINSGLLTFEPVIYTARQIVVIAFLYLLPTILMIVLYVYYSKSYQVKKATIKAK